MRLTLAKQWLIKDKRNKMDDLDTELAAVYQSTANETPTEAVPEEKTEITDVVEQPEAPAVEEITDQEESVEGGTEKPAIQPPQSWSAEMKEKFKTFPAEAQEELVRRQKEMDDTFFRKTQEKSQELREREEFVSALEPIQPTLSELGLSPAQAVKEFVGLYRFSEEDPIGYINHYAQSKGLELAKLATGEYDARDIKLSQLQSELYNIKAQQENYLKSQDMNLRRELEARVEQFKSRPENKYFEQVRPIMARLVATGQASNEEEAYKAAIWLDENVREAVLKDREQERLKQEKERVAKAKKLSNTGLSSKEISTGGKVYSLDEELASVYRKNVGGSAA